MGTLCASSIRILSRTIREAEDSVFKRLAKTPFAEALVENRPSLHQNFLEPAKKRSNISKSS
jgi:hypothetical protein